MLEKLLQYLTNTKHLKNADELEKMVEHFQKAAPRSFGENHFDLSAATGIDHRKWEEFLKFPYIQEYIEEQMALVNSTNATKAMINLGDARTSTDIQAAKFVQQMAKGDKQRSSKPFTVQFLPEDTLKLTKALLTVYKIMMTTKDEDAIFEAIFEVIPPTQEDLDAITKIKALRTS